MNPDPRIEAARSAPSAASDRNPRRRRMVSRRIGDRPDSLISARPSTNPIALSSSKAPSSSVMNSGLPAAFSTACIRFGPGSAASQSFTSACTPSGSRPRTSRRRAPASVNIDMTRANSGLRGTGRVQATSATGNEATRRTSVASVSRLDGSAHCRSSTPSSVGPDNADCSIRSTISSITRNCSPGSLLTVTGEWLRSSLVSRAAMWARRGSVEAAAHESSRTISPNGRLSSSSSPRPTNTPIRRRRASSSTCANSRLLPTPASPSRTTTDGR